MAIRRPGDRKIDTVVFLSRAVPTGAWLWFHKRWKLRKSVYQGR